jgi:NADPH-dependent 2,4-dienoyl-CoA reductase/sulfur reductase-like enzyme
MPTRILVIGGSDAGISAALRVRECDPAAAVTMLVADGYPNFSICGIPYFLSGEVADWHALAHRTIDQIEAAGIELRLNERAIAIDPEAKIVTTVTGGGRYRVSYDRLVIATGAEPMLPPIAGLPGLGPAHGVHVLHTMDDTFAVHEILEQPDRKRVAIIGAGYIGLEMAEALTARGRQVTVLEAYQQVLPRTLDAELAQHVQTELERRGVEVLSGATVEAMARDGDKIVITNGGKQDRVADLVLVAGGVTPAVELAADAGVRLGTASAIAVDTRMRTNLPDVFAAGDCVHTHHVLLAEPTYMPLGTTAHKQGRVAGENSVGGDRMFTGIVGTQIVRVFDVVIAATGLRDQAATSAGYRPLTVAATADDHKRYYPGATPIHMRITGDAYTGRILGAQLVGRLGAEIAKRIDVIATACQHDLTVDELNDLDLSYTPPLGSPWDALQLAAQAWSTARSGQPRHVKA